MKEKTEHKFGGGVKPLTINEKSSNWRRKSRIRGFSNRFYNLS